MVERISMLYRTAKRHFSNVELLPGESLFFLCSDANLSLAVPQRLRAKGIQTSFIHGSFNGNVTKERVESVRRILEEDGALNADFSPRLMSLFFREWFAKHGTTPSYFILILVAVTVAYGILIKKDEYILFSTGLTVMGMEMVIVFAFQALYGYVYMKIGAIVTGFLLGLLPGAFFGNLLRVRHHLSVFLSEVCILFLITSFALWVFMFKGPFHPWLFIGYGFTLSLFCGFQFPQITALIGEASSPAAGCLAADLAGASIGTLAAGAVFVPFLGLRETLLFLMGVKLSSVVVAAWGFGGKK
jgi:spermidine synthase